MLISTNYRFFIDSAANKVYIDISQANPMKAIQLTDNLRYIQLNDEKGDFGLIVVHTDNHVHYTIQVENEAELRAAVESFQENPVGTLSWLNNTYQRPPKDIIMR